MSLQKNITEPFRRLRTQHQVDTKKKEEACTLAIKTVKRYQKLHYNTNQDFFFFLKKKAKGSNVYPNTDDLN